MAEMKTPGVYIEEKNAFPNAVVEVATAVPAFIGYTEKASRGAADLTNVPTRISSLAEYEELFGGPPQTQFDLVGTTVTPVAASRFLLAYGMRLFFDNGGGPCWIVSVGGYRDGDDWVTRKAADFEQAWPLLAKEQEPTMIVVPDAVLLAPPAWLAVSDGALRHCVALRDRIAILDTFDGFKPRTGGDDDVISGQTGFRSRIESDFPSYGVAYYPWLHTNIVEAADLDYTRLREDSRSSLADAVKAALVAQNGGAALPQDVSDLVAKLEASGATPQEVRTTHNGLMAISDPYRLVMAAMLEAINVMPPSAAMAGVYARVDNTVGVFKAPANTGIASVLSPTVAISHEDQEDLNVPLDGKAVNAIRTFPGRGVLIWGARTLDGNSQDFRYVNVRRTLIMLEQSIKLAAEAYVFAANDASTWVTVRSMIENFLNNQWKAGALAGATPAQAYSVSVGLGSTMTGNDILDGYMRVTVAVAVVRPAEFIVITFEQKMQTS